MLPLTRLARISLCLQLQVAALILLHASTYGVQASDIAAGSLITIGSGYDYGTPPTTGDISGRVTRESDGHPLAGVWVNVGNYYSTTSDDGSYTINDLAAGDYTVQIAPDYYTLDILLPDYNNDSLQNTKSTPVTVTVGKTTRGIDFRLLTGRITGVVTQASDGLPVPGVWVSAGGKYTTTGSDGAYTLTDLSPGNHTLYANAYETELVAEYYRGSFTRNAATPVAVAVNETTAGIDFTLTLGGRISGVVTQAADGQPVSGIHVSADGRSATTWIDGSYTITGVSPGSHEVHFDGDRTDFVSQDYTGPASVITPVAVRSGETTAGIDFSLIAKGKISGIVTREADGQPATRLRVYCELYQESVSTVPPIGGTADEGRKITSTLSRADGSYTLSGLDNGLYTVGVYTGTTGLAEEYFHDAFTAADATLVTVAVGKTAAGIDFDLAPYGRITGTVTRDSDGQPLARVFVSTDGQSTFTNADGTYLLANVAPARHIVSVSPPGEMPLLSESLAAEVRPGQTTAGIDFGLALGGSITGTVTGKATGQPLAGVTVTAGGHYATTGADGSYTITGLASGRYEISVYTYGTDFLSVDYPDYPWNSPNPVAVAVTAGQATTGIDFRLPLGGRISGRVTRAVDDLPLKGITISALYGRTITGADGTYTITGLRPGTEYIHVDTMGTDFAETYYNGVFTVQAATSVMVTAGGSVTGIDFSLTTGGRLTGTVTRASNGRPLAGLCVAIRDATDTFLFTADDNQRKLCPVGYGTARNVSTGPDGSFTFSGLTTGSYRVFVRATGTELASEYYNGVYTLQSATPVTVTTGQTTTDIDFSLEPGGSITGTAIWENDGLPAAGLTVTAGERSTVTRFDGTYAITGLAPDSYTVNVDVNVEVVPKNPELTTFNSRIFLAGLPSPPSVVGQSTEVNEFNATTPATVTLGQTTAGIDFNLLAPGAIAGVITQGKEGEPLRDVHVTAGDRNAYTRADGSYIITGLAPGNHTVQAGTNQSTFVPEYYDNSFDPQGATEVTVHPGQTTGAIDFSLTLLGKISGRVTGLNGQPLSGARVIAVDHATGTHRGTAITAVDGSYLFHDLPPGSYQLQAATDDPGVERRYFPSAPNAGGAVPITVAAGKTTAAINFELTSFPFLAVDLNDDGAISPRDLSLALGNLTGRDEMNGAHVAGPRQAILALQYLAGLRGVFRLPPPRIDGILSPGEWDDAKRATIETMVGPAVEVLYKNDADHLYIAFPNLVNGAARWYPAILLDTGNNGGPARDKDDWGFVVSHQVCEGRGAFDSWQPCEKALQGWMANTLQTPTATLVEVAIEYEKVGLVPGEAKTIGVTFRVGSYPEGQRSWPAAAEFNIPATWGRWELRDKAATHPDHPD